METTIFESEELRQLETLAQQRRTIKRYQHLFRAGSPLQYLYLIRAGSFKSCVLDSNGREQITGFHMNGELLGSCAIGTGKHLCDMMALEDSSVYEISFAEVERLVHEIPTLQRCLNRAMSREVERNYKSMLLLGSMRAEERLATFLLDLSQRFAKQGYSATEFNLRMTREEIGSYLGLKFETVSRMFSNFRESHSIEVKNRAIEIKDLNRLQQMVGHYA